MKHSQRVNLSPTEMLGTHTNRSSERRNGSSGNKKKQGEQHNETIEVIENAMEFANGQLSSITD